MVDCLYLSDEWNRLVADGWTTLYVGDDSIACMMAPERGDEWDGPEEPEYGPLDGGYWEAEDMYPY